MMLGSTGVDGDRLYLMDLLVFRRADQFPRGAAIDRSEDALQGAGNQQFGIRGSSGEGSNGLTLHVLLPGPVFAAIVADVESAVCAIDHPGTYQDVLWVGRIDDYAVQDEVVPLL